MTISPHRSRHWLAGVQSKQEKKAAFRSGFFLGGGGTGKMSQPAKANRHKSAKTSKNCHLFRSPATPKSMLPSFSAESVGRRKVEEMKRFCGNGERKPLSDHTVNLATMDNSSDKGKSLIANGENIENRSDKSPCVSVGSEILLAMETECNRFLKANSSKKRVVPPTLSKTINYLLQSSEVKLAIEKQCYSYTTLLEATFKGMEVSDLLGSSRDNGHERHKADITAALESLAMSYPGKNTLINSWGRLVRELGAVLNVPPVTKKVKSSFESEKKFGLSDYRLFLAKISKQYKTSPIASQKILLAESLDRAQKEVEITSKKIPPRLLDIEKRLERKKAEEAKRKAAGKEEEERLALERALRPLTSDEQNQVHAIIFGRKGQGTDIIATSETDSVQRDSLRRLRPGVWLNDEVIHYFLLMLARRDEAICRSDPSRRRSHFFKSFFVTKLLDERGYCYSNVKRWSKKVPGKDIFLLDKIICPVNVHNSHWTCAVIFVKKKRIQYYDSMGAPGLDTLKGLLRYLVDEYKAKKNKVLDTSEWKLVPSEPDTPQQANGYDCGVFTCMFADFISRDFALTFTQDHVTECRERVALSILNGSALE